MGEGTGGPLADVVVGFGDMMGTMDVVKVNCGGAGPSLVPSIQYERPVLRVEQSVTSGFNFLNSSSVVSHEAAMVLQVSPALAGARKLHLIARLS